MGDSQGWDIFLMCQQIQNKIQISITKVGKMILKFGLEQTQVKIPSEAWSTLSRSNLKMQLYLYSYM